VISLIILGAIFIVSIIVLSIDINKDMNSIGLSIALGILISMIIVLLLSIIPITVANSLETVKADETSSKEIYALKDDGNLSGSFFLGCGQINNDMYYVYLVSDNDGYKIEQIYCDDVTIVETNKQPRIIEYKKKYKNESIKLWIPEPLTSKIVIEIPKGSIKYDFKVNLE